MPIDLLTFVRKWNASLLTERSAAPQHFRNLCEVLGILTQGMQCCFKSFHMIDEDRLHRPLWNLRDNVEAKG